MRFLFLFLLSVPIFATEDWLDLVSNRIDQEAVVWAKQLMEGSPEIKSPCKSCLKTPVFEGQSDDIQIFMSFSVPDEVWLSLDSDKEGVIFVIRGLPNESFADLSQKLFKLREKGLKGPVQINPNAFDEYQVSSVPTFLYKEYTLSGSVSLDYAKSKIEEVAGV